jgi:hypothetical protein
LEKLLKDPSKEVFIPSGPKEKELRAPREMMKNVQGSSAGVSTTLSLVVVSLLPESYVWASYNRREVVNFTFTSKTEEENTND